MIEYLTLDDVRGLHADVMRRTGFLPAPLRDLGALESAITRPQMVVAHYEGADLLTQAVTLMLAISQAQAFVDGNKRTAMFAALVFLELNGSTFDGDDEVLAVLLEEAASRPHDEARATIAEWMRPQIVTQRDERDIPRTEGDPDAKNRLHRRWQSHFYTQSRARSADLPGARR